MDNRLDENANASADRTPPGGRRVGGREETKSRKGWKVHGRQLHFSDAGNKGARSSRTATRLSKKVPGFSDVQCSAVHPTGTNIVGPDFPLDQPFSLSLFLALFRFSKAERIRVIPSANVIATYTPRAERERFIGRLSPDDFLSEIFSLSRARVDTWLERRIFRKSEISAWLGNRNSTKVSFCNARGGGTGQEQRAIITGVPSAKPLKSVLTSWIRRISPI